MTLPRKMESESRRYLQNLLNTRISKLKNRILLHINDTRAIENTKEEFNETLVHIDKILDIFSVRRLTYRHEIIFKGNNKIDPNNFR